MGYIPFRQPIERIVTRVFRKFGKRGFTESDINYIISSMKVKSITGREVRRILENHHLAMDRKSYRDPREYRGYEVVYYFREPWGVRRMEMRTLTVERLRELCKEYGINGYSGKRRDDLITMLRGIYF
jgi:hypothetical protein